jgi:hypothetical protein
MPPINEGLRTALSSLQDKIEETEAALRKHPGSSKASVPLEDRFDDTTYLFENAYLETCRDDSGNLRICVAWYRDVGDMPSETKLLSEFHTQLRLDLSRNIPSLLKSAVDAEKEVQKEAEEVAVEIEQGLAEFRKDT